MDTLYTLVKTVMEFPELYIGKPSLELLYAFINGYLIGNPKADDQCLNGFNEFVAEKYRLYSDHNWAQIIQFFSPSEEYAFGRFKSLFDEYTQRTGDGPSKTGDGSLSWKVKQDGGRFSVLESQNESRKRSIKMIHDKGYPFGRSVD